MQDFLYEQIKTIKNLCEIAMILRQSSRDDLLPTILELLCIEAEDMVGEYCTVKDDSSPSEGNVSLPYVTAHVCSNGLQNNAVTHELV